MLAACGIQNLLEHNPGGGGGNLGGHLGVVEEVKCVV